MPECPHCNNDVAGDAKFCPHCGKRDPADASYSSYNGPDDIWTAFAFGWVGAIVGAVIGGIIGVQNGAFIKWVVAGAFYGYVGSRRAGGLSFADTLQIIRAFYRGESRPTTCHWRNISSEVQEGQSLEKG